MKKIISSLLTIALLLVMPTNVFASTPKLFQEATEVITSEYLQRGISAYSLDDQDTIIHNNGKAIKSDYFAEGKDEGNYLFAVKCENTAYGVVETAYFANVESMSTGELVEIVSNSNNNIEKLEPVSKARSADAPIYKNYQWSFYSNNILQSTLTTTVELTRQTTTATMNNVPCSVWDVVTFSQLERENCIRLNNQYTRLSVDYTNQKLISYGPDESTSGGDVSVGLDGAGVPSVSYTFNIDGFSIEDLSSLSKKYGRWSFIDKLGSEQHFTTKPGIRATNTSGDFIVELSHTMNASVDSFNTIDKSTGVLQIYCTDR